MPTDVARWCRGKPLAGPRGYLAAVREESCFVRGCFGKCCQSVDIEELMLGRRLFE